MNLALKTSLGSSKINFSKEVMALLTDMHEDFNRFETYDSLLYFLPNF